MHILKGKAPLLIEPLRPQLFFFNVVNKLWYITGGEDGGQDSSELYVYFRRRKQIHILGQPPPLNPLRARFF